MTANQIVTGAIPVLLVLVVWLGFATIRGDALDRENAQALRKSTLERVLQEPKQFSRVWQQSGYDEGFEYAYLWAVDIKTSTRLQLANTSEYEEVVAQLRAKGIAIHNGPPGTVS